VLNGTTAHVCRRVAAGAGFAEAVREAQAEGYAEPDPSEDLSGRDAARKLAVLAWRLGHGPAPFPLEVVPLDAARLAALRTSGPAGVPAYVARLSFAEDGSVRRGSVAPETLPPGHPLAGLRGAENGIVLEGDVIDRLVLRGPGAGPRPTAAALLDDVVLAARTASGKGAA
jgi:homoserine dehydrogenase